MPITVVSGDLFNQPVQALVNPVNTVGVMGAGLALQFKERFPQCFRPYQQACRQGRLQTGQVMVWPLPQPQGTVEYIIHFPTKQHWRQPSRYEDLINGIASLVREVAHRQIKSLAIPPLGAGLGGLNPRTVRRMLEADLDKLSQTGVEIILTEPLPAGQSQNRAPRR